MEHNKDDIKAVTDLFVTMAKLKITRATGEVTEHKITPGVEYAFELPKITEVPLVDQIDENDPVTESQLEASFIIFFVLSFFFNKKQQAVN